ncbi:hypothetical protein [Streptomyces anulatus]|uniref:hypothetical protein n=1 Tax=Streptomyces anulatus TaxID=1892 RepID=UPI002E119BF4|nr:hypothetical protein OG274_38320 [Streptomyces anulatus]
MLDLAMLGRLALDGTDAHLRPVFDPVLRTFSVQLWAGDGIRGVHGMSEGFNFADEPLEAMDAFLAERGVRALTAEEAVMLYAGLVRAEGGLDWQAMRLQLGAHTQA